MSDICDHTSVGMLVWRDGKLLLIEKRKFPFAFAPPAGHVDDDVISWEKSAKRELKEEVGLQTTSLEVLIEGRKDNPCRREDGIWHYWRIYQMETRGEVRRSEEETKQAGWYSREEVKALAQRTLDFQRKKIKLKEWQKAPGLESVWYEWFKELKII